MKIRKGDIVKIISGNDKGKQGKVLSVFPHERKIVVEKLNMKKKHVRPRKQGQKGEMVRMPASFSASRVMLVCSKCSQPTRVGHKFNDSSQKLRGCKKCGGET